MLPTFVATLERFNLAMHMRNTSGFGQHQESKNQPWLWRQVASDSLGRGEVPVILRVQTNPCLADRPKVDALASLQLLATSGVVALVFHHSCRLQKRAYQMLKKTTSLTFFSSRGPETRINTSSRQGGFRKPWCGGSLWHPCVYVVFGASTFSDWPNFRLARLRERLLRQV